LRAEPIRHRFRSAREAKLRRRSDPISPLSAWAKRIAAAPNATGCHSVTVDEVNTAGNVTSSSDASTTPP